MFTFNELLIQLRINEMFSVSIVFDQMKKIVLVFEWVVLYSCQQNNCLFSRFTFYQNEDIL